MFVMPRQKTLNLTIQWRIYQKLDGQFLSNIFHGNLLGSPINYYYKNTSEKRKNVTKNIKIVYFNGVNVVKHWHVAGEVFAISDCLVGICHDSEIISIY